MYSYYFNVTLYVIENYFKQFLFIVLARNLKNRNEYEKDISFDCLLFIHAILSYSIMPLVSV